MNLGLTILLFTLTAVDSPKQAISIELVIPKLSISPYHRPYLAVWLETEQRQGVHTIALWFEGREWLKDMRQWWRKQGQAKKRTAFDGVTGATRKPGTYRITKDGLDTQGNPIPAGVYFLNLEASRENGGREFLRQKVVLGSNTSKTYTLSGSSELGKVTISIH